MYLALRSHRRAVLQCFEAPLCVSFRTTSRGKSISRDQRALLKANTGARSCLCVSPVWLEAASKRLSRREFFGVELVPGWRERSSMRRPHPSSASVLIFFVMTLDEPCHYDVERARVVTPQRSSYMAARCVAGKNAQTIFRVASNESVWAPASVGTVSRRANVPVSNTSMTPGSPIATYR
jgi:hypothetical protein